MILYDEYVAQPSGSLAQAVLMLFLYFAYMFVCGKYGNRWIALNLEKRGFESTTA